MPAWYHIYDIGIDRKVDETQLLKSADTIRKLIEREGKSGIDSRRIILPVLAGFSQDGAAGYQLALSYPKLLAELLVMSTCFATKRSIVLSHENKELPIRIFRDTCDPMVTEVQCKKAYEKLLEEGYQIEYKSYSMQHNVCVEQVSDISTCLQSILFKVGSRSTKPTFRTCPACQHSSMRIVSV